jgi:ubiquinone/menaquinone biosynthesis C-methylase UbiE
LAKTNYTYVTKEWIQNKHHLSTWLEAYLFKNKHDRGNILSIGCGLGVVEQPLIDKGMTFDLQECQDKSIGYLKEKYPKTYEKTHFILSNDLKEVGNAHYDTVLAITSTYCLTDEELDDFMKSVARILKPKGIFIWYETALTWRDLFNTFKQKLLRRKSKGVLWGWKRSHYNVVNCAQKHHLMSKASYFFDKHNHEQTPFTFLRFPLDIHTPWQMIVLQKHD